MQNEQIICTYLLTPSEQGFLTVLSVLFTDQSDRKYHPKDVWERERERERGRVCVLDRDRGYIRVCVCVGETVCIR